MRCVFLQIRFKELSQDISNFHLSETWINSGSIHDAGAKRPDTDLIPDP